MIEKNSGGGATNPPSPNTGSTTTAATDFGSYDALKGVFQVFRAKYAAAGILQRIRAAIAVGVWNTIDVRGERLETSFVRMRFAGERHCQHRASVECILKTYDGRTMRVASRDFYGIFNRLRAAIYQNSFLGKFPRRERIQLLGKLDILPVWRHTEACVKECIQLPTNGSQHAGRAMPHIQTADSASKVDVAISIHIFQHRAFCSRREDGSCVRHATRARLRCDDASALAIWVRE